MALLGGGVCPSSKWRRVFFTVLELMMLYLLMIACSTSISAAAPDCSASLVRFMPCVDYAIRASSGGSGNDSDGNSITKLQESCCSAVREQLMVPAANIPSNDHDSGNGAPDGDGNATCVCAAMQAMAGADGAVHNSLPDINGDSYRQYMLALPTVCSLRFQQPCLPLTPKPPGTSPSPPPQGQQNGSSSPYPPSTAPSGGGGGSSPPPRAPSPPASQSYPAPPPPLTPDHVFAVAPSRVAASPAGGVDVSSGPSAGLAPSISSSLPNVDEAAPPTVSGTVVGLQVSSALVWAAVMMVAMANNN